MTLDHVPSRQMAGGSLQAACGQPWAVRHQDSQKASVPWPPMGHTFRPVRLLPEKLNSIEGYHTTLNLPGLAFELGTEQEGEIT